MASASRYRMWMIPLPVDPSNSSVADFGYHANPTKTWLVTKEGHLDKATNFFAGSGVNITTSGRPYLGALIGSEQFVEEFTKSKVDSWVSNIALLSEIAKSQPHAAFTALTHGLLNKWSYYSRV